MRKIAMALIFVAIVLAGGAVRADCKDEVCELRGKHTQKARAEAQKELVAAQAHTANLPKVS